MKRTDDTEDPDTARRLVQERRIAREGRQGHRVKDGRWVEVDRAIEIAVEEGIEDAADHLRVAVKQGLLCRFQHRKRWWVSKPVEEVAPLPAGRNPLDLENDDWQLVVHEGFWREYLALRRPAGRSPEAPSPGPTAAPEAVAEAPSAPASINIEKKSNAGAPPQHDWDEAIQCAKQLWEDLGDPRDPLNARGDWRSDIDLARRVADHLQRHDPGREPPDAKTIADKLRPEIKKLRGGNG